MYHQLMNVKEVAELLRVAPSTVYKMVTAVQVDYVKYGSAIRIKPESLGITEMLTDVVARERAEMPAFESILKDLIPELDRAFKVVPAFGEVGFKVVFHESQPVRVEITSSLSLLVDMKGRGR